jgi:hypothetical protein
MGTRKDEEEPRVSTRRMSSEHAERRSAKCNTTDEDKEPLAQYLAREWSIETPLHVQRMVGLTLLTKVMFRCRRFACNAETVGVLPDGTLFALQHQTIRIGLATDTADHSVVFTTASVVVSPTTIATAAAITAAAGVDVHIIVAHVRSNVESVSTRDHGHRTPSAFEKSWVDD